MKRFWILLIIIILAGGLFFLMRQKNVNNNSNLNQVNFNSNSNTLLNTNSGNSNQATQNQNNDLNQPVTNQSGLIQNQNSNTNPSQSLLFPPISNALSRITKKPFGIYITPQNSPVQPERFTGYHTGVDFETLPSEANINVPIYAAANGEVLVK
ncbi:MAG: hypothetical protein COT26_01390 [Candidatus Kerfeldbacteria bacterium CG08_land_8_20_14_0_20_43_14]|uniref:Peptidase M23 domain-containing protein n=1 Tax=Candidatus Kerfeldbacteria bacterium CG08_land_8_20_14_0_20_43_14 TaxID=2014246 RepID=A0A2H0YQV1_9BACT|nr:MAG: hypothetical protein COT26_01390 [Candidatus Kerfeldbacteria bacterium CG08_land_8_20_14_0_20_43_14]